ncbi:glycosyltransferase family 2 protein [bacterium]|nr:glycosyltransferase family 2 protein [bacterium]
MAAARGEFIAFQNHDDRAMPQRLERQIEFLRKHPECGAMVSGVDFMDPQGADDRPSAGTAVDATAAALGRADGMPVPPPRPRANEKSLRSPA